MSKFPKRVSDKVADVMREKKAGTLKTGSGKKVSSSKQAIAIGLSEARAEGDKVPTKKNASKKSVIKKATAGKNPAKKTASKKRQKIG